MTLNRTAAVASAVLVTITVLAGLYLSGSPAEQRLRRMDEQRVAHLNQLVYVVQSYWQQQGAPPETLQTLVDGRRLNQLPVDPVSGKPYQYEAADSAFRLCATFDRPSPETAAQAFWQHPAGRYCFSFDSAPVMPPGAIATFPAMRLGP